MWLPFLPTERIRACAAPAEPPLVLVETVANAMRVTAVDRPAMALGLAPGLTLADARARVPVLDARPRQGGAELHLLRRLLADFGRFTPMAALDAPLGLMLDVTGCAHLFGDEPGLLRRARQRAAALGFEARLALAGTPQAARALARFGKGGVHDPAEARAAVRRLSIAALEIADTDQLALRRAGLKTIGDLDDRPRAPLAARFGADFPHRLARVLGDEDIRITPHRPAPPCRADRVFAEPMTETEGVEGVLKDLLAEVMEQLEQVGQGGRAFEAGFWRVDGLVRRVTVRTGRPTRDVRAVARLFSERLARLANPLDPGFGFDQMRLSGTVSEALAPAQEGLERRARASADPETLIDTLAARLGEAAVGRFRYLDSHIPERASTVAAARDETSSDIWPHPEPGQPPLRPLHLFDPPQPVDNVTASVPDGPPVRFTWRRVTHQVAHVEGPERIAPEWWRNPKAPVRDYYRVEDRDGRRFWLFRSGQYGEPAAPRWYVHGLFA